MRLTESNFIMFAMKSYQNHSCLDLQDFYDDLKTIRYIKRAFNRYKNSDTIGIRLVLNHIISFYNVFGAEAGTKILFFKLPQKFWPQLKTFLVYLHYMPERIIDVGDKDIISSDIPLDLNIVEMLREI